MQKRLPYLAAFLTLLAVEILIACFVRDAFIRPYAGDILATAWLCSLARLFFPVRFRLLPLAVFAFSVLIELCQYVNLAAMLNVQGTWLGVVLGATFDWTDILCYFIGCVVFFLVEFAIKKLYASNRRRKNCGA